VSYFSFIVRRWSCTVSG